MTGASYPTIKGNPGREFYDAGDLTRMVRSPAALDELPIEWVTVGDSGASEGAPRFDTSPLYDLGERAMEEVASGTFATGPSAQAGERFEAKYALEFHGVVHELPGALLTDRDFWRFLALGPFLPCTIWRQNGKNLPTALGLPSSTGRRRRERSFDLKRLLPWRLYMRAEIGGEEYVEVIGSDLWWSHLFGVNIGRSKITAHAFLDHARAQPVNAQRLFAPLLTADRGRFVFDSLDDPEVRERVGTTAAHVAREKPEEEEPEDPAHADESDYRDEYE